MATRRQRSTRSIGEIFLADDADPLANVYHRSLDLLALQASIRNELGPPLAGHLYVAGSDTVTLMVFTDSSVWAARLRFITARILAAANACTGAGFKTLRVRISPLLKPEPALQTRISISPASSRLLERVAENIDDAELRASFLQLSRHR